jgi:hypothetical protein
MPGQTTAPALAPPHTTRVVYSSFSGRSEADAVERMEFRICPTRLLSSLSVCPCLPRLSSV